jgi:hypothetical protein
MYRILNLISIQLNLGRSHEISKRLISLVLRLEASSEPKTTAHLCYDIVIVIGRPLYLKQHTSWMCCINIFCSSVLVLKIISTLMNFKILILCCEFIYFFRYSEISERRNFFCLSSLILFVFKFDGVVLFTLLGIRVNLSFMTG